MASDKHLRYAVARLITDSKHLRRGWYEWKKFSSFMAAKNAASLPPAVLLCEKTAVVDRKEGTVIFSRDSTPEERKGGA